MVKNAWVGCEGFLRCFGGVSCWLFGLNATNIAPKIPTKYLFELICDLYQSHSLPSALFLLLHFHFQAEDWHSQTCSCFAYLCSMLNWQYFIYLKLFILCFLIFWSLFHFLLLWWNLALRCSSSEEFTELRKDGLSLTDSEKEWKHVPRPPG